MVTMKEIAELAGVSHGTVSNVLSKKGNVSVEKIALVENAAKKLGYIKNTQAQNLRQESSKLVSIILPNIGLKRYNDFYSTIYKLLFDAGFLVTLYLTDGVLYTEKNCVHNALSQRSKYIILLSCSKNAFQIYKENGITSIIYVETPSVDNNIVKSISFNYSQIAKKIAENINLKPKSRIAFWGNIRQNPLDAAISEELEKIFFHSNYSFTTINSAHNFIQNDVLDILALTPQYDMVICADEQRRSVMLNMSKFSGFSCPEIYTITSKRILKGYSPSEYSIDYIELASICFKNILKIEHGKIFKNKIVNSKYPTPLVRNGTDWEISMLTIDSPTTDALRNLSSHLEENTGIKLNIVSLPYNDVINVFSSPGRLNYDLIRIDMLWFYRLKQNVFLELDSLPISIDKITQNFLPSISNAYYRETGNEYVLPLDPSVQMMFYRKDLMNDISIKRNYYEMTKKHLCIPKTFKEFDNVSRFFTKKYNPLSPVEYGNIMTYGSIQVTANSFMPRIWSFVQESFESSCESPFKTQEFEKAAEDYIKSNDYSVNGRNYWWNDALKSFANANSAATMAFVNHASRILTNQESSIIGRIGTAVVPDNSPLLGGGCIGVYKYSEKTTQCVDFLNWLYSEEIANLIALFGGFTPCRCAYFNEEILLQYPWLRNISLHFDSASRLFRNKRLSYFDNYDFEQLIGKEMRNVILGVSSLKNAIEKMDYAYSHTILQYTK